MRDQLQRLTRITTGHADAYQIWFGAISGLFAGISGLLEDWGVAVSFVLALAATFFALGIFVLIVRNDLLEWVGGIFGSEYTRYAKLLIRLPSGERKLEQKRFLIADAYHMVDKVERRFWHAKALGKPVYLENLFKQQAIYFRIEDEMSDDVKDAIHGTPGIRIERAISVGGQENREQRLLRLVRQDIARLEKKWNLL